MPFQYKRIAIVGATSGIGEALAERFIAEGAFVIAVGRRKEKLEGLVQKHGHEKVQAVPFDITKLESIPAFVTNITNTYADLDCVVLNSGMQRKCDLSDTDSIDLDAIQLEMMTNYTAQVALTKAFLPFLKAKTDPSALIYISSGLALVPSPGVANYCATKAALHHFILCLRQSLKDTAVNVVEVYPPAVQTELHDVNPDIKDGRSMGMPLDEFTNSAYEGLAKGLEQVPVGMAQNGFNAFEIKRQEVFAHMLKAMSSKK